MFVLQGLVYGPMVASALQVPLVTLRPEGTLPGPTHSHTFNTDIGVRYSSYKMGVKV